MKTNSKNLPSKSTLLNAESVINRKPSFEVLPQMMADLTAKIDYLNYQISKLQGNTQTEKSDVLTMMELCKLSGYTKNTIYQLVHKRAIPFRKRMNSSKLIFLRSEIEEWLLATKPETANEYCDRKEAELSNRLTKGGR